MSLPPSPAEAVVVVAEVMVPAEIAAQIARLRSPTLRWCASEPPLESRIKPSRRAGPSRGTDGSNPSPSRRESAANLTPADARASRDFTATLNRVSDQLAHDGVPEGDELHRSGRGTLGAVRRLGYLRPEARGLLDRALSRARHMMGQYSPVHNGEKN